MAKRCHPRESAIDGCSQVLESITRQSVFLKSAKGAARTAQRIRNLFAPRSVLRVFLKSAKGAARITKGVGNWFAPHSVLRVFLKAQRVRRAPPRESGTGSRSTPFCACSSQRKGCGAHHQGSRELVRAALRFARVPQKAASNVRRPPPELRVSKRNPRTFLDQAAKLRSMLRGRTLAFFLAHLPNEREDLFGELLRTALKTEVEAVSFADWPSARTRRSVTRFDLEQIVARVEKHVLKKQSVNVMPTAVVRPHPPRHYCLYTSRSDV